MNTTAAQDIHTISVEQLTGARDNDLDHARRLVGFADALLVEAFDTGSEVTAQAAATCYQSASYRRWSANERQAVLDDLNAERAAA